MKLLTSLIVLFAILECSAHADEPATRPIAVSKVLVLPFTQLDPSTDYMWIGTGVQQSLQADVAKLRNIAAAVPSNSAPIRDESDAVGSARAIGARYVVFGSYQVIETDVRFAGVLIDVGTNRTIGTLKSTGPISEFFILQDALGKQLERQLSETAGVNIAASAVPEIEPKAPLQLGGRPVLFKGIAPSVATDRNAIAGTYRYQYGQTSAYDLPYGYFGFHYPASCGWFGRAHLPYGY